MTKLFSRFCILSASVLTVLFLQSCGCGNSSNKSFRIGVDSSWYPLNFYGQEDYVNGFVEEMLLEVSRYSGLEFERINANWDALLDGMREKRYHATLSSLPPYNFNTAKYDISGNFLDLGPVLVIPADSKTANLDEMSNEIVGVLVGDQAVLILQKHPDVIMRNYNSVPEALEAVMRGEVEGILLDRLLAISYVRDLFEGKLKVAGSPLNNLGLHLVTPKGQHVHEVNLFNKSIAHLSKKKKLEQLQKKWQLD